MEEIEVKEENIGMKMLDTWIASTQENEKGNGEKMSEIERMEELNKKVEAAATAAAAAQGFSPCFFFLVTISFSPY